MPLPWHTESATETVREVYCRINPRTEARGQASRRGVKGAGSGLTCNTCLNRREARGHTRRGVRPQARGAGSGITCNTCLNRRMLVVIHRPADSHSASTKMLRDRLHAIGASTVGIDKRSVPIRVARGIVVQRIGQSTTLAFRDVLQRALGINQRLHALNKRFGTQVDLAFQLEPRTGGADPVGDKPAIRGNRVLSGLRKGVRGSSSNRGPECRRARDTFWDSKSPK